MCDCPFCRTPVVTSGPRPMQVNLTPYCFWAYLMYNDGTSLRIAVYSPRDQHYKYFTTKIDTVEYLLLESTRDNGLHAIEHDRERFAGFANQTGVMLCRDGTPISDVRILEWTCRPPPIAHDHALCMTGFPSTTSVSCSQKRKRREPRKPRARTTTVAQPSALAARPPSPFLAAGGSRRDESYDIRSIGGRRDAVLEAHRARPVWDAEVVLEILRNGGAPPLLEIEAVLRHEHRREAVCRFRHPSGRSTAPMALPFPILHLYYPETAARFV